MPILLTVPRKSSFQADTPKTLVPTSAVRRATTPRLRCGITVVQNIRRNGKLGHQETTELVKER